MTAWKIDLRVLKDHPRETMKIPGIKKERRIVQSHKGSLPLDVWSSRLGGRREDLEKESRG
jgi:hypothetical protein